MDNPINVDSIGSRWGILLTSAFAQIVTLEAEKDALIARILQLEQDKNELLARLETNRHPVDTSQNNS